MEINIETASLSDAKVLNELLTKLIIDEKKYDKNVNDKIKITSYYENIINSKNACILVAKKNNLIVGYLYGYLVDQGNSYLKTTSVIDALYIEEEYRKLGIASALIEVFKGWSKNNDATIIEIKILNENNAAKSLYLESGFKPCKTILQIEL